MASVDPDGGVEAIHLAIHEGKIDRVKELLQMGVHPDAPKGYISSMGLAASVNENEICQVLLDAGADVNFGGRSGRFPLYITAHNRNLALAQLLVERGAKLDLQWMNGNTCLLEATVKNCTGMVTMLLEAGSSPFLANNAGESGLHMAAARGNEVILKEFLKAGLDANGSNIKRRKSVGIISNTGIHPLHMAAYGPNGGHPHIAKVLISHGADLDAETISGRTPLHICAMRNAYLVADILLASGCKIDPISMENNEHKTPLMKAVDAGHLEMVNRLISAGADLNFTEVWGCTPLITAAFNNKTRIVKSLIQAGADLNRRSKNGMSPLKASLRHPPNVTQMLLVAGCRPGADIRALFEEELAECVGKLSPKAWQWVVQYIHNPKHLQLICRENIRRNIGERPQKKLLNLPLPQRLKDYLNLTDLDFFLENVKAL